jgi:hypothetical protein
MNKGWSDFLSENNSQGQLQTPQSVTVGVTETMTLGEDRRYCYWN